MTVTPLKPMRSGPFGGYRVQKLIVRALGWALLALVLLIALFPVYFMGITAFHPPTLSFGSKPTIFSTDLTLKAFQDLLRQYPFLIWLRNTFLVSICSTILSVTFSTFAAYSLSRLRYPGRRWLSNGVFLVYLFPSTLLFIPIYILLSDDRRLSHLHDPLLRLAPEGVFPQYPDGVGGCGDGGRRDPLPEYDQGGHAIGDAGHRRRIRLCLHLVLE